MNMVKRMNKKLKVSLAAAAVVGVGLGVAGASSDSSFVATWFGWPSVSAGQSELTGVGLFFDTNGANNTIRMFDGSDSINLGDDDDGLHLSNGQDAIMFGGDGEDGAITFDTAGGSVAGAFTSSTVYLRAYDPDDASLIEVRADDVIVTANDGDFIIQLGS